MEAFVKTELKHNIGCITFFHPAGNSFPGAQLQKLVEAIETLDQNEAVTLILLQSEGNSFCAGASFDELVAIEDL